MDDFRFEKLEIWKESIEITDVLFDYADKADDKKLFKFAEQLRSAAMSSVPCALSSELFIRKL